MATLPNKSATGMLPEPLARLSEAILLRFLFLVIVLSNHRATLAVICGAIHERPLSSVGKVQKPIFWKCSKFRVFCHSIHSNLCIRILKQKIKDKFALITGGTNGMGFATAQQFINEGGKVIITGRSAETVNKAVEQLGTNAFGIVSNAGNMKDIFRLQEQVKQHTENIDLL